MPAPPGSSRKVLCMEFLALRGCLVSVLIKHTNALCYIRHVYASLESTGPSPDLYPRHLCLLFARLFSNGRTEVTCH